MDAKCNNSNAGARPGYAINYSCTFRRSPDPNNTSHSQRTEYSLPEGYKMSSVSRVSPHQKNVYLNASVRIRECAGFMYGWRRLGLVRGPNSVQGDQTGRIGRLCPTTSPSPSTITKGWSACAPASSPPYSPAPPSPTTCQRLATDRPAADARCVHRLHISPHSPQLFRHVLCSLPPISPRRTSPPSSNHS